MDQKKALMALKEAGLTFSQCVEVFGETEASSPYVALARVRQEEGVCEVDEAAVVSKSELGAYVQSWIWVGNDELPDGTQIRTRDGIVLTKQGTEWINGDRSFEGSLEDIDVDWEFVK